MKLKCVEDFGGENALYSFRKGSEYIINHKEFYGACWLSIYDKDLVVMNMRPFLLDGMNSTFTKHFLMDNEDLMFLKLRYRE